MSAPSRRTTGIIINRNGQGILSNSPYAFLTNLSKAQREEVEAKSPAFKRYCLQHSGGCDANEIAHVGFQEAQFFLRYQRQGHWCEAVADTILNLKKPQQVCSKWSNVSIELLKKGADFLAGQEMNDIAIFALGKLGAQELNLSSDVDLLFVCSELRSVHMKFLRQFQRLFTEITAEGFCYRVDLDLRPGGTQGPVLPSFSQVEDYYLNYGETWERMAFSRLLPLWGSPDIISQVVQFFKKFSFRRHLDFTLFSDLLSLRKKIHSHYWQEDQNQWDLKHGMGGIRDVELFAHALQIIHGGKDESLRLRSTSAAFEGYKDRKILPEQDAEFLKQHYWILRGLENYAQSVNDEQTYVISKHLEAPDFVKNLLTNLEEKFSRADRLVSGLIGVVDRHLRSVPSDIEAQKKWLVSVGLSKDNIENTWPELIAGEVKSHQKERDEEIRLQFLFAFIESLKDSTDPNMAFRNLLDFIKSVKAKATFFTLLCREPLLIKELVLLFSTSPLLSQTICARPELLDSFVYRATEVYSSSFDEFLENLIEKKLLNQVLAGTDFLKNLDVIQLTKALSQSADSICKDLLSEIKREFSSSLNLVAMGKWGGEELGFLSDLDMVLVTQGIPTAEDHKVARRLVSRLSEAHRGGNIYNVDLRLRPGGSQSLFITSFEQTLDFLKHEATCWERQAYLRSRPLFTPTDSSESLVHLAVARGLSLDEIKILTDIRHQLLAKGKANVDVKYSQGGFIDIEFALQIFFLEKKWVPRSVNTLEMLNQVGEVDSKLKTSTQEVKKHYIFLRSCEQLYRLFTSIGETSFMHDESTLIKMAAYFRDEPAVFASRITSALSQNHQWLFSLDPCRRQG